MQDQQTAVCWWSSVLLLPASVVGMEQLLMLVYILLGCFCCYQHDHHMSNLVIISNAHTPQVG